MNLSQPFVRRPIGTVLLTVGVALAGIAGFFVLPVSPLPQVDFPTISVSASLPGASPETMATSVATPLERRLGTIAGVNEMTSSSSTGSTRITPAVRPRTRNIDGAAREVQAAINACRVDLPATLRSNPTYRKANPSDAPVIILALTSKTKTPGQIYDAVSNIVSQRLAQVDGVGDVEIGGGSLPAVRVELLPFALNQLRHQRRGRARRDPGGQRQPAEGRSRATAGACRSTPRRRRGGRRLRADGRRLAQRRGGAPGGRRRGRRRRRGHAHPRPLQRRAGGHRADHAPAGRQRHRDGRRRARAAARAAGAAAGRRDAAGRLRQHQLDPRLAARDRDHAADLGRAGGPGGQRCSCAACARPSSRRWRRWSRCSAPSA